MRWWRPLLCTTLVAAPIVSGGPLHAATDTPAARVQCAFSRLDDRGKIGQISMVSLVGDVPLGHTVNLLKSWRAGGIILFSRNISTAANLKAMIANAQTANTLPLLVATDQEGGTVVRIRVGLTPMPAAAVYGAAGSSARLYADTYAQGRALKQLGVNMNLAPVVDVRVALDSAIGTRSYGSNPALDSTLVSAAIAGYQAAGIAATAKHFIGLGEVRTNADLALPVVRATRAQLEQRDMPPMRAAVKASVDAMMVTRVVIPALDPSNTTAYASRLMIDGVIRGELGYNGMLITDSLLTPAIFAGPGPITAALAALRAGDDMLLLGGGDRSYESTINHVLAALSHAVALGAIPQSRLDDAVLHVLRLKAKLGLLPPC